MTSFARRLGQIAIVSAFFAFLLLPIIQMVTGHPQIPVLNENRNRERAPTLAEISRPIAYISQAQKWFTDHYGYRDWLIRAKTQIDYSVFGTSDKVYIGRKGWLYSRSVMDVEKPAEEAMTDNQLQTVVNRFAQLRDFLKGRGIRLVVVTNQLKDKFYPEYLPYTARRTSNHQRFDNFRERMHAISGLTYIDSTDILEPLKAGKLIFHKTDLHWNDPAAAEVARAIVDKIAALEGRKLPFWRLPIKTRIGEMSGSDAIFMPLFYSPKEQALFMDQKFPAPPYSYEADKGPFEYIMRMTRPAQELLPPVLLCGDSFSDGLTRSGLNDHFQAVYRARRGKVSLQEVLAHLPPDIHSFIYQFIEVSLPSLDKQLALDSMRTETK